MIMIYQIMQKHLTKKKIKDTQPGCYLQEEKGMSLPPERMDNMGRKIIFVTKFSYKIYTKMKGPTSVNMVVH